MHLNEARRSAYVAAVTLGDRDVSSLRQLLDEADGADGEITIESVLDLLGRALEDQKDVVAWSGAPRDGTPLGDGPETYRSPRGQVARRASFSDVRGTVLGPGEVDSDAEEDGGEGENPVFQRSAPVPVLLPSVGAGSPRRMTTEAAGLARSRTPTTPPSGRARTPQSPLGARPQSRGSSRFVLDRVRMPDESRPMSPRRRSNSISVSRPGAMTPTGLASLDMRSPLEKAVAILEDVKRIPGVEACVPDLDYVVRVLTSSESMFVPDFQAALANAQQAAQQAQADKERRQAAEASLDVTNFILDFTTLRDTSRTKMTFKRVAKKFVKSARMARRMAEREMPVMLPTDLPVENRHVVLDLLHDTIDSIDFDCFRFAELTGGRPLLCVMYELFRRYDLFERFDVELDKFERFITAIEDGYVSANPYHNSTHATDVVQTLHCYIVNTSLGARLTDRDIFAALLAAACHDYGHPGLNNAYQILTESELATRYNDKSVLESFHLAASFALMREPSMDVLCNLDKADRKAVRNNIVSLVLGTDLAKHFELVGYFKGRVEEMKAAGEILSDTDRLAALTMALKCADVSNPVKNSSLYLRWTERVMEEFYRQGDVELAEGLPVSTFFDRREPQVSKCQRGFVDFIVRPLYESLCAYLPELGDRLVQLKQNRDMWAQLDANRAKYSPRPKSRGAPPPS